MQLFAEQVAGNEEKQLHDALNSLVFTTGKAKNASDRVPVKKLSSIFKISRLVSADILLGTVPVSILFWNSKLVNLTRFPIFSGMVPVKLFPSKPNEAKVVTPVIPEGMLPVN